MTLAVFCVAVLMAQPPTAPPQRDRPAAVTAKGTATVSGIVTTDAEKPVPLRRARVLLSNSEINFNRTIVTDDTGRFAFRGVPAGRFNLTASKEAFVDMAYGARRPGGTGTSLVIQDGAEISGITLRLPHGAVITGTVTDAFGQPLADVQVGALQYAFVSGERRLTARSGGRTDDRGVYRFFGLRPGQYLVTAYGSRPAQFANTPDVLIASDVDMERALKDPERGATTTSALGVGRPASYAPVFFPNALLAAQASPIDVAAGEERSGVDMQLLMVPTGRIEGSISFADGDLLPTVQVTLTTVSETGPMGIEGFRSARADGGKFQFGGLVPGDYVLAARANLPGEANSALWASTPVSVTGETVLPIALELRRGFRISGRLQFDGDAAPPSNLSAWRVGLTPLQGRNDVSLGVTAAEVQADGSFTISGVTPGRFRINPSASGNTWMARAVTLAGRDVFDAPLEIHSDLDGLVVTFTDRISQLSGKLQDAAGRASDAYVILFPSDRSLWIPQSLRIQAMRAGSDGGFAFKRVPPGSYLLATTVDVEAGEWMDPAFLQRLAPAAIAISIAEGEQKIQDLRAGAR